MNEDTFNMSMRKFLKKVGVTSQREIEKAVEHALQNEKINGDESLATHVLVSIPELGVTFDIDGDITLE